MLRSASHYTGYSHTDECGGPDAVTSRRVMSRGGNKGVSRRQ